MTTVRIAAGQGFWGDWLEAPVNQIRMGEIDFLMLDYLAEVTMSILSKQKQRNPERGYAPDFVELISRIAPDIAKTGTCVIANAGGVNPHSCAQAVKKLLAEKGLAEKIPVAIVTGDDIADRIDELLSAGQTLDHMESHRALSEIRPHIRSANAYIGCAPVVEALEKGAQIVITGRVADAALALAPMVYVHGWSLDDWDRLASGIVAGHIIECGAQASGGNCSYDWESIPDLAQIGFPIVQMDADGSFEVYKHPGTGGRIDIRTVKEQLLYEIGDPENYIVPDVVADFTSINLSSSGQNRVKVNKVKGKPRTEYFKVSISYFDGYMAFGTLIYSWPDAYKKSQAADRIVRERIKTLNLDIDAVHSETIGANACHGPLTDSDPGGIAEVMFRIAVRSKDKGSTERFTREIAPLVLSGPPSATAYSGGKRQVQEVLAYWPSLLKKEFITPRVELI